jgi:adenylate kinase
MKISLLGAPGAGKSTLANILSGIFDVIVISSGDIARANGFAGSAAEKSGKLDPNEEKIRTLVKNAVGDSDNYILDGFPRTIEQIEHVDIKIDAVLYLNVSYLTGNGRLIKRGRPDDTTEIIQNRLETYVDHTHPLVQYFLDKEKLIYINANGTIAESLRQAIVSMAARGIIEASMYVDSLIKEFENGYEARLNKRISKQNKAGGSDSV